jgi:hypothetical protein
LVAEGIKRTTIRRQRVSNNRQRVELGVMPRNFTSGTARNYTPVNSIYQAPKIGQRMALYQGMRTANCNLLRDETLANYHAIQILPDGQIFLDNQLLNETSALRLARLDGFLTVDEMIAFFEKHYGLPFGDNERPADMLQWSVHIKDTLWLGFSEQSPLSVCSLSQNQP